VVFFCAALAIAPFAKLIVRGTEQVAAYTGATIGGLLNATFGNLLELIIAMAALRAGLHGPGEPSRSQHRHSSGKLRPDRPVRGPTSGAGCTGYGPAAVPAGVLAAAILYLVPTVTP
jgi:hypothetical protein